MQFTQVVPLQQPFAFASNHTKIPQRLVTMPIMYGPVQAQHCHQEKTWSLCTRPSVPRPPNEHHHTCYLWRTMMLPGITASPPNFFTPRNFGLESRPASEHQWQEAAKNEPRTPFFEPPPAFLVAVRTGTECCSVVPPTPTAPHTQVGSCCW